MQYDKDLLAHKLQRWDQYISNYRLPEWDAIPDFGLYMDQVVILLEKYLTFIPDPSGNKDRFITSAIINNYVRLKIMPAPIKRKYHRVHIAYLIMILTLKQSLSISDVQKIIPSNLSDEDIKAVYQAYSAKFHKLALFFIHQVEDAASDINNPENDITNTAGLFIIESALIAGFAKILAEKLLRLSDADSDETLANEISRDNR
ncbi:MAG: DUF1836 domain-containing protein [Clostridiales bacterium]|nr:DUF1836 domain-containing protein [Candidatus Cacconaster stercorequi]